MCSSSTKVSPIFFAYRTIPTSNMLLARINDAADKGGVDYRRTKNLRAVQLLLCHSKLVSTVHYLGIEIDDALEVSEQTEA